jgi:hypothetical protein
VHQLVIAAIKTELHPENMNREEGSKLSKAQNRRTRLIREEHATNGNKINDNRDIRLRVRWETTQFHSTLMQKGQASI